MADTASLQSQAASLQDVAARLRGLDRRERSILLLGGLLKLHLEALGLFFIALLVDWLFRLPFVGRLLISLLAAGLLAHGAWIHLLWPLLRRIELDDLALRVESAFPRLEDRLISAVQLSRPDAFGRLGASPALIEALVEDCKRAVAPLDFRALVTLQSLKRLAAAALAASTIGGAFTALKMPVVRVFVARCAGADVPYPTRTRIIEHTGSLKILRGDTVTLKAVVAGEIPHKGELHVVSDARGTRLAVPLKSEKAAGGDETATFSAELKTVIENLHCRFRIGDAVSDTIAVSAIDPPQLAELQVDVEYPEYTGIGVRRLPAGVGDIEALAGSAVSLAGRASKPLASAALAVYPRNAPGYRLECSMQPPDGFAGGLRLESDGFYEIHLTDSDGFGQPEPVRHKLRALPDNQPSITVDGPGDGRTWLQQAVWPLWGSVEDDYGIVSLKMCWQIRDGANGEMPLKLAAPERTPHGRLRYAFKVGIENSRLPVKLHDEVAWKVVAADNRPAEPGTDESREYSFVVVDWATKMQELLDLREELSREISRLADEQGRIASQLPAPESIQKPPVRQGDMQ